MMKWSPTTYVVFWSIMMAVSTGLGFAIFWQLRQLTAAILKLIAKL